MIRLFDRNETNFNHNKTILTPLSCYVLEEANGMYELESEFPKNIVINEGDIIKAPSPRGEQLFRIYRVKKSLKGKKVNARHIFYDLSKNFLVDVNLNNVSGFTAIQSVLSNCETSHNFVATSDVLTQNTATYKRINPVQAIVGDENSIINLYGGNLIRNNFNIQIKAKGTDRGYEIRMGKNLIGIDADIDESSIKTRIYPTVVLGDNDTVYYLPEKYIDSPLINNYGEPIIYTEEIKLTDEQKNLPFEQIYNIMRDYCNNLFETYNVDKPVINYKVDFVELSKTEQYKELAILEQLDLYDIVTVNVSHIDINIKARVIKYRYDCLKDRYESIELGDFSSVSSYKTDSIVKQIHERIKVNESATEYATNVITGNKGGYIITRRYPNGKPYEFLIMDTEDINTAQNVFRLNNSGLGFSQNGYNGTFGTAMTIDGHIVADYMDTGTLTSILLQSANYKPDISGTKINLADGTINSKNFKVDSIGNIIANNAKLNNGEFAGSIISTSGNIGGWNINSSGLISTTPGTAIEIYNSTNHSMRLDYRGLHLYDSLGGTNQYLGGIVETYNSTYGANGMCMLQAADAEYLAIGYTSSTSSTNTGITPAMYYCHNGFSGQGLSAGFTFLANVDMYGNNISDCGNIECTGVSVNGYTVVHNGNIGSKTVNSAYNLIGSGATMYVSSGDNFISTNSSSCIGSSFNPFNAIYAVNEFGTISDENKKNNINKLDDRYIKFAKLLMDLPRSFKLNKPYSESGRVHVGFIAQSIESALAESKLTDMDFAGLVKEPRYEIILEGGEYDKTSNIIGYDYYLRYMEFVPLSFEMLRIQSDVINEQSDKISDLEIKNDMLEKRLLELEQRLSRLEVA